MDFGMEVDRGCILWGDPVLDAHHDYDRALRPPEALVNRVSLFDFPIDKIL